MGRDIEIHEEFRIGVWATLAVEEYLELNTVNSQIKPMFFEGEGNGHHAFDKSAVVTGDAVQLGNSTQQLIAFWSDRSKDDAIIGKS